MDMHKLEAVYKKWETGGSGKTSLEGSSDHDGRKWGSGRFGGDIPRRRRRSGGRQFGQTATLDFVPELAHFKTSPPAFYDTTEGKRPFPGRCCNQCSSTSREMLYSPSFPSMGFRNILKFPPGRRSGYIAKYFPNFAAAISEGYNYEYPPLPVTANKVLSHKRLHTAINKSAMLDTEGTSQSDEELQQSAKVHKSRAVSVLLDMAANISNTLLRIAGFVLLKMLSVFLMSVQVHQGQLEMVRQATLKDVPVIILPMHRSHLDYILMSFILHIYGIRVPYVAAGDNLNIPVLSWIMRRLGAFYIKRKMDKEVGRKDWVYRATLHSYMEDVLRSNQNMEFFIEGGRSRSGKPLIPKGGLLSVIVDAFMDGVIPDAYLVPVSVSYEKILDGNFNNEQMGLPKEKETLFKALTSLFHVVKTSFGHVRVDFAQPFSLKEYMDNAHMPSAPSSDLSVVNPRSPTLRKSSSDHSLYGTDIVIEDQRQLIKGLGDHVIYDAMNVNTVMSTNIVAFLLLSKYRQGISFNKLVTEVDWLKGEIISRGRDIGFTGKTEDVVKHAIKLLGPKLISLQKPDQCPDVVPQSDAPKDDRGEQGDMVVPNIELPNVFELSYYANCVTSVFLMESILANSITAVCNHTVVTLKANAHHKIQVSKEAVMEKAVMLCDLLQYEFTFMPPCGHLSTLISEALEQLTIRDILIVEETRTTMYAGKDSQWARRVAASWDDEDMGTLELPDEKVQINTKTESLDYLYFLQSVLGPLIEGYWLSACNLVRLLDQDGPESDFAKQVNTYAKDRVAKGLAVYAESCAMDTLRNSWKLFIHWKVMDSYHDAEKVKMVQLREPYRTEEKLGMLIDRIEAFRT